MLQINDLHVTIDDKLILKGVNLTIKAGEIVALMGPNGSGKSTLAQVIMGNPEYTITKGSITFNGKDIHELDPDERAKLGLFLSFQYPVEIPGVTVANMLRTAVNARRENPISVPDFMRLLYEQFSLLDIKKDFADRYVNTGFSGGEKKMTEILQLAVLEPQLALLDETDSGLDIDALQRVATGVNAVHKKLKGMGILIITHYQRILNYIKPDKVIILLDGKIREEGGPELVEKLESHGYDWLRD